MFIYHLIIYSRVLLKKRLNRNGTMLLLTAIYLTQKCSTADILDSKMLLPI